ncbi:MAG TPA: hypothetical protein VNH19_23010 [Candidatus Limnocylindrales bacterium]|jgi:hypothetical protein|nr:hypothetical protein [Candidatus Limnocylindrales bacterium]
MEESELLKRLDELAALKIGDPIPEWLPANDWGTPVSELCREAADKIRFLRGVAGVVSK